MTIDIERIAREADLDAAQSKQFRDERGQEMTSPEAEEWRKVCAFAALVLEEAAKVCDTTPPQPFRPSIEAAHAIRQIAASLTAKDGQ